MISGDGGWQVIGVDVEEKGYQNGSLWEAILEVLLPIQFAFSGGKG